MRHQSRRDSGPLATIAWMADQQNPRQPPLGSRALAAARRPRVTGCSRRAQQDPRSGRTAQAAGTSAAWRGAPPAPGRQQQHARGRGGPVAGSRADPRGPRNQWVMLAAIVAVLLAINLWVSSAALSPNRVRIPYSPTFLTPAEGRQRRTISSTSLTRSRGRSRRPSAYQGNSAHRSTSRRRSRRSPTTSALRRCC